jgi:hypothetical protein
LLDDVIEWIKKKYDDVYIVNELIKVASSCPQGSLNVFVTSVDVHLRRIQKRRGDRVRKKEANIEVLKEEREKEIRRQRILRNQQEREINKELNEIMNFEEEEVLQMPQMPQEEIIQPPKPQPQPQPQPQSRPVSKDQLDMRRRFAQRISEMSQEDEIDGEWMK